MSIKLEICNKALRGLSEQGITSLQETSDRAEIVLTSYDNAFDRLTSEHRFSFLLNDVELNQPLPTEESPSFSYKFRVPENFERLVAVQRSPFDYYNVLIQSLYRTPYKLEDWQLRGDGFIYSNFNPLYLLYLRKDPENFNTFPRSFTHAMVLLMQAELSISLRKSPVLHNVFVPKAERALLKAVNNDIDQSKSMVRKDDEDPVEYRNHYGRFRRF